MTHTIPDGWRKVKLREIADISSGASAPQELECFEKGDVPFVRTGDVGKVKLSTNFNKVHDYLNKRTIEKRKIAVFKKGTILLPKSGASTFLNYRVMLGIDAAVSSHLATVKVTKANALFVYYALCRTRSQDLVPENGYPSLRLSDLSSCNIMLPSDKEQEKIANIIFEVDEAINQTDNTIKQIEKIEKGLMNTILVKGIKHKEFVHTDIGRIPKGWVQYAIGDLVKEISDGGTPPRSKESYFGGDIPWVVIDDIRFNIWDTREHLTKEGFEKCSSNLWPVDSLIISTGASIGEVGLAKVPLATKQGITGMVVKENIVNPEYLAIWLKYKKNHLIKLAQGTSIKEVRPPTLCKLKIILPKRKEQDEIVRIIDQFDNRKEGENNKKRMLQAIKKGLMQKLLTGQIRLEVS